jgi:exopolysaccharide biosynthesis polyprenyl glycosylphosphotransferase
VTRAISKALPVGHTKERNVRPPGAWMLILPIDFLTTLSPIPFNPMHTRALLTMAVLTVPLLAGAGLYRPRLHLSFLDDLPVMGGRLLIATSLVAGITGLRHRIETVDSFIRVAAIEIPLVLLGRVIAYWIIRTARRTRFATHRAIVVGSGPIAADLIHVLARDSQYGLDVVGYVDEPGDRWLLNSLWLGRVLDLQTALVRLEADVVLVADARAEENQFSEIIEASIGHTHDVLVVPRMSRFPTRNARQDHIGAIPVMRVRLPVLNGWRWRLKRTFDVTMSALAIALLSPVLLICAIAVRLEGGPGVLFRQERVGRNGNTFQVLKFRSMRPRDENDSRTTWSIANDSRVGPVGKILRRTSLDELPQLWNILRGDMTIVGPRPERPHFVEQFSAEHPHYARRHRVPVGLTGLAQVSGLRGDTPIGDRARFDNYYIEHWSLWLDFKIIVRTLRELFTAAGR